MRAIIIQGAGGNFCGGHDLRQIHEQTQQEGSSKRYFEVRERTTMTHLGLRSAYHHDPAMERHGVTAHPAACCLPCRPLSPSQEFFARCSRFMVSLQRVPHPVIASVRGIATGAGCQLVAACDMAVASSDSRFATSGTVPSCQCCPPVDDDLYYPPHPT